MIRKDKMKHMDKDCGCMPVELRALLSKKGISLGDGLELYDVRCACCGKVVGKTWVNPFVRIGERDTDGETPMICLDCADLSKEPLTASEKTPAVSKKSLTVSKKGIDVGDAKRKEVSNILGVEDVLTSLKDDPIFLDKHPKIPVDGDDVLGEGTMSTSMDEHYD